MYTSRSLFTTLASCLSLTTLVTAVPANHQQLSVAKRNATIEQSVFFNINGTEVESRIAKLKSHGYRPTSLSIHGSPTNAKYAGIWTRQEGNAYETILGANETAYNAWLERWTASGYVSTHVSATGSASDAIFAGVMQQTSSVGTWIQQCGLGNPYAYQNATLDTPMVIKSVSMYGGPNERQYCILGHEDTTNHQQTVWYQTDSFKYDYNTLETDETSKRFWRPVFIDSSEDNLLTPIFDDTTVGRWKAFTDLTSTQLESEFATQKSENMYPIHISGAGSSSARYTVIFVEQLTPLEREWHATGDVTGYNDNAGVSDTLDQVMQSFMKRNSVRQAQVAASINGTVIASRAYTWAESDRAIVQPSDKFLLGSVSKAFTYAAVDHLISSGLLNLTTPVYPLLGFTDPADPRSQDITVQHLLDHTAGFDRGVSPDIGFIFTLVAQHLQQSTPATLLQVIEYIYAQPLDFSPGERSVYSNYGTMLLSFMLEHLTNTTYTSYLQTHILDGLDVDTYLTPSTAHTHDTIRQESKFVAVSALQPLSHQKSPLVHGGDGSVKEAAAGAFGLRASASSISQFLGTHSAYGIGGRAAWTYRDGTVAGARAMAYSLQDVDWAVVLNTREYSSEKEWEGLVFGDLGDVWGRFSLRDM